MLSVIFPEINSTNCVGKPSTFSYICPNLLRGKNLFYSTTKFARIGNWEKWCIYSTCKEVEIRMQCWWGFFLAGISAALARNEGMVKVRGDRKEEERVGEV